LSTYDFEAQRLYVDAPLSQGERVAPPPPAQNYLLNVLRLRAGDAILLFNGRDGEWRARLEMASKRTAVLAVEAQTRTQDKGGAVDYVFAPLKHARLDYMAQKAVEMGASRLVPVLTQRSQIRSVNIERLRANAIEAAEQCGILSLPEISAPQTLDDFLANLPVERLLIFCDEDAPLADPIAALNSVRARNPQDSAAAALSVLIGPEGGFDEAEREKILRRPNVLRLSLGPRVLRADTAAVAALTLAQAWFGDWRRS